MFAALRAPTIAVVRGLSTGGQFEKELSKRRFGEGLARAPYNVPDFPVPTHLLQLREDTSQLAHEVAENIAEVFSLPGGLEGVKDFFLTGLLSLEEIQVSLPYLVKDSVVEEAVARIIHSGAEHFTYREWQELVHKPRNVALAPRDADTIVDGYNEQQAMQEQREQVGVSLASPVPQHRELPALQSPPLASPTSGSNVEVSTTAALGSSSNVVDSPPPVNREPRLPVMTEPLPTREVRNEAPITFSTASTAKPAGSEHVNVIDWGHSQVRIDGGEHIAGNGPSSSSSELNHPADAGAGKEQAMLQEEQAAACWADPRLISLDMHNECSGPFLAIAFVRCCQLYDVRRFDSAPLS